MEEKIYAMKISEIISDKSVWIQSFQNNDTAVYCKPCELEVHKQKLIEKFGDVEMMNQRTYMDVWRIKDCGQQNMLNNI